MILTCLFFRPLFANNWNYPPRLSMRKMNLRAGPLNAGKLRRLCMYIIVSKAHWWYRVTSRLKFRWKCVQSYCSLLFYCYLSAVISLSVLGWIHSPESHSRKPWTQVSWIYWMDLHLFLSNPQQSSYLAAPPLIGQYKEPHPTVRAAWSTFKGQVDSYIHFHHHQLQKLKSGDDSIHTLTWSCYNPVECCGIGDQLYIIQQALVYAIISNRVLSLHWNPVSYETMKYLTPNKIDWTYFNRSQGMKDRHSREQYRVSMKQYLLISYSYYVCRVII